MNQHYHTLVIGGGCLGVASALSIQRKLGNKAGKVAILEKKVLGAGLSSRHSAIVRSANGSAMAARMAKLATQHWQHLKPIWGVDIPFEKPGAIWIADNTGAQTAQSWLKLEQTMQQEGITFAMISHQEVLDVCQQAIRTGSDEMYYYEPDVLQLDSPQILNAMQTAVKKNGIDVYEHCQVYDFQLDHPLTITAVNTSQGRFFADHIVNACGGWSSELFAGIGIRIPVALQPVHVANFLVGFNDIPESMPIIADFVNHAYFRRWRGSILHMHQPRRRQARAIASAFSRTTMNPDGANVIYDALSFNVNHQQLDDYVDKVINRFPKIGKPVYAGGYHSFFDITPDLKFILGVDTQRANLYHCLGAGQALKYAPIFGELIADLIIDQKISYPSLDIAPFSIARFHQNDSASDWHNQSFNSNTL